MFSQLVPPDNSSHPDSHTPAGSEFPAILAIDRVLWGELLLILILLISVTVLPVSCSSDAHNGEFASVNRYFSAESGSSPVVNQSGAICCGSGPLRTSPLDLSYLSGKKVLVAEESDLNQTPRAEAVLPSRYDLRENGKVPQIRDQGVSGSCWDFAAVKSLESSFLPAASEDFSENNLKNRVSAYYPEGFDYTDGGNDLMSAAYFNRWSGPVPDRLDPYNPYSSKSPDNLPVSAHIADIPMLPGRSGPLDNDNIKNGVLQYGCLYTTFSYDNTYYNESAAAYYNPKATTADHAVCIIGWDDNYPKTSFMQEAPGDGAFICANSWGTAWGEKGFFYLSYYDTLVGKTVTAFTGSGTGDYDGNYGYDPLGWVSSFGFGTETASGANLFRAEADEQIEAVGFYVPQVNSRLSIGVYVNPDSGPVSAKGPDIYETKAYQVPGYHIFRFETPVSVRKGDRFSVEIGFLTPDYGFPVPVEYAVPGYSSKATASPGQSWVKATDGAWSDLTKWDGTANVCIRAYTRRTTGPKADFSADTVSGTPPLTVRFTDLSSGVPKRWLWQFGDGATSTEQNPVHTYTQVGRYSVSLTVDRPGGESKTVKENFISTAAPMAITVPDDHSLIQEAIDMAQEGSTIKVRYGYYPEKLAISKPLTLIGESNPEGQKPIIDAQFRGTPVSITAAGVTVQGFSITGGYADNVIRPGVAVKGNRVKIVDNWIFENYAGIWCENTSQVVIDGNIIWNSSAEGLYSESSSDLAMYNNTLMFSGTTPGILMVNGERGVVRGNIIAENTDSGLALSKVHGLTVYDNYFNNSANTVIGSDVSCSWNNQKTAGLNIVRGPYIGGNYWAAPDGSGFSETHQDLNGDGFCDESFTFDGQTDSLPLATPGGGTVVADFEAAPTSGQAPLTVRFSDRSTGPVESWNWNLGDGSTATDQNPSHTYILPGSYDVSLTVTGGGLSHTTARRSYITTTGTGPDYRLMLSQGWNLISVPRPLLSGTDTAALLAGVNTGGHSILTFTGSAWVIVKKDDILTPLSGYWIYSGEQAIIPLYYSTVSGIPERELNAGWNLIGSPRPVITSAKTAFSQLGSSWAYLIGYDRTLQKYEDVIIRGGTGQNSDDREIKPGTGYWLLMEKSGTLQSVYS